jgi:hypothetical protein
VQRTSFLFYRARNQAISLQLCDSRKAPIVPGDDAECIAFDKTIKVIAMNRKLKRRSARRNAVPRNARQAETRERALATVSLMRREKLPLKLASRAERIRPSTVLRYAKSALRKSKGDYRVKAYDRIPRTLNVVGRKGMQSVAVGSSRKASQIGRYMNAVKKFVRTNNQTDLRMFRGKRVPGTNQKFVVGPATLKRLADAGVLEIDKLYSRTKGL